MLRSSAWVLSWSLVRILAAALGVAAIVAQLTRTVARANETTSGHAGDVPTVVANFLSYFTIESNLIAAIALAIGGMWALGRGRAAAAEPRWFAILLACATTYMVITGIVYNTLLRGVVLDQGVTVAWSNEVLHVVIPIVLLLDLVLAPKRRALAWSTVWAVAAFPLVWVIYTLVRGPLITAPATGDPWWYPYPFLDPHNFENGYVGVALYIIGIAIGIMIVGLGVVWIGRRRARSREAGARAAAS